MTKKRRRPIDQGASSISSTAAGGPANYAIKMEPVDGVGAGDYGFEVSELEALALEMQGFGKARREDGDLEEIEPSPESGGDKELDDGFWEELFSEGVQDADEDVDVLANRFRYLGSSSK